MNDEPPVDPNADRDEQTQAISHDVTRILNAFNQEDSQSANALIASVYNELRRLAAWHLSKEKPGQTLQATALVNEAYLRLFHPTTQNWKNRRHFFGAAAEAMRRILIENARRKARLKRGGNAVKAEIELEELPFEDVDSIDLLDLSVALDELETVDDEAAELVKLRYFGGLTMQEVAELFGVTRRTATNIWSFARTWLYRRMKDEG